MLKIRYFIKSHAENVSILIRSHDKKRIIKSHTKTNIIKSCDKIHLSKVVVKNIIKSCDEKTFIKSHGEKYYQKLCWNYFYEKSCEKTKQNPRQKRHVLKNNWVWLVRRVHNDARFGFGACHTSSTSEGACWSVWA